MRIEIVSFFLVDEFIEDDSSFDQFLCSKCSYCLIFPLALNESLSLPLCIFVYRTSIASVTMKRYSIFKNRQQVNKSFKALALCSDKLVICLMLGNFFFHQFTTIINIKEI